MRLIIGITALTLAIPAFAGDGITVTMHSVDREGVGDAVGEVEITHNKHGLVITPALEGLPLGLHGFHLHEHASCAPLEKAGKVTPAGAAGGHYDPEGSGEHGTPWGDGHRGDLPALFVDANGNAEYPVLAPRLNLKDLDGRALMVHAGGDNHSDHPEALGGGGARIYCGVIEK
ncbi:MAG: superoxide dismutase [Cu-Zn] SodC [Gammaproteobacteria bacterium]